MIWDWVNLYHMYLFRLILQAKSFVLFYLWYSSCFEVKCWIHTFHKRCSHIAMWILILLDHRGRHVNSFPTGAFSLQVDPIIFNIREINSKLFSMVFVSSAPRCLCFSRPPTLFLQGLRFLNQVSFLLMRSLFILFFQCSHPVISHEDTNGASSSSFFVSFIFPGGFKSSFVDLTLFLISMPSHTGAPHNNSLLAIHLFRHAQVFSKGSSCHLRSFQALSRLLSHSWHLIQPVQSLV